MMILGTVVNACGILLGAALGAAGRGGLAPETQGNLRTGIGILTVFAGLHLVWTHLGGGFGAVCRQFVVVLLAMTLGRIAGSLLRLQHGSNRLGRAASDTLDRVGRGGPRNFTDGFTTCAVLYCVAPMSILGAVQEGLGGDCRILALKAAVDGLSALSLVRVFGAGAVCALLPLVAWQGSLTLAVRLAEPWVRAHGWTDPVVATVGFLLFSVALLILEIRKVAVADYLPSLAMAPLLVRLWRW